jgi:type I restriction-modification system DNA methylase subunit
MSISWNEIKTRAANFILEWKDKAPAAREEADAQTFENEFFHIFGVERSKVAIFEQRVKVSAEADGYIDLFWKGHIIIEMKSPGKDLERAYRQAKEYANALRGEEMPKCILICDFRHFHYYDLERNAARIEFPVDELVQRVELFGDLAGYKDVEYKEQDAVNVAAAERMGKLHDRLKEIGYSGHQLEVFLVRILFCLFADDTGIFEHDSFIKYIVQRTNPDGSDLGLHLEKIFETLNKEPGHRQKTLDRQLDRFPYINGGLFSERLDVADFDSKMRESIIECCTLDWSKISPAIFGAMFQSVMNAEERRNLGAHYTSETNILKLIHPLFLDDLWAEFDKIKTLKSDVRVVRLNEFHDKLSRLKFLDPACGCGNFLVITYRELRILELEVIRELLGGERLLDVDHYIKVNVDQFYGIELEEFPAQIAEVAMWLMDHQMNMLVRDKFGEYYIRIPLRKSATIRCANALTTDWESVVPKSELSYILGNPPFVGAMMMTETQRDELVATFGESFDGIGELDYVSAWYKKAIDYIFGTSIECAFVSTNSISQGQQVALLWQGLIEQKHLRINFAHQTFKWSNEAKGVASVFCIIVGFALIDRKMKRLYSYADVTSEPVEQIVTRINPYLMDGQDVFIKNRSDPLSPVPQMSFGNMPRDGGGFILSDEERNELLEKEPLSRKWIRPYIGAVEFINNKPRWCLWLVDANPSEIQLCPIVLKRVEYVRKFRLESKAAATRKFAITPTLFCQITQLAGQDYIIIPGVSSERRKYIPMGFMDKNTVSSNLVQIIPNATLYHFGILTSTMHMAWMRYVCGRLEMRYRYSKDIVYNNFPWPKPTDKQREDIEAAAQAVLDARAKFPDCSLADLYDPDTMPPELAKAHAKLDRLVEKAYGKSFESDAERVAFLFERYQQLTADLFTETPKKRGRPSGKRKDDSEKD